MKLMRIFLRDSMCFLHLRLLVSSLCMFLLMEVFSFEKHDGKPAQSVRYFPGLLLLCHHRGRDTALRLDHPDLSDLHGGTASLWRHHRHRPGPPGGLPVSRLLESLPAIPTDASYLQSRDYSRILQHVGGKIELKSKSIL